MSWKTGLHPTSSSVEPAAPATPPPTTDAEDVEDLGVEDSVIRELARSLRPKHR